MKKTLHILVALLFAFVGIAKAQVIEIGTGENATYTIPYNTIWINCFQEEIFEAAEIGVAGPIYYLSFHLDETEDLLSREVTVYMKHVTRTDFYDENDYEPVLSSDIVFYGTWMITPGWSSIVLDEPFDYNGVDNLMVAFYVTESGCEHRDFYYTDAVSKTLSYYSDSEIPNPYDLGSFGGAKYLVTARANIRLGFTNCAAPTFISAMASPSNTHVIWDGVASTYTLQYRQTSASIWTSVNNLTGNSYDISSLEDGNYVVRVQSDCDPDHWVSTEFMIYTPESTATWYGFANTVYGAAPWEKKFVSFTMQNPAAAASATMDYLYYDIWAGTFANGYVWIIDGGSGDLMKAPVTDTYHLIGTFENVMESFVSGTMVWNMSYNPVYEKIYYIENPGGSYILKSFDPNYPSTVSTHGIIDIEVSAFAINKTGQAYVLEAYSGKLYSLNLANAQVTLVGETGFYPYQGNAMAFDMNTGELFWSAYLDSGVGMYYIDHTNANTMFLGQVGDVGAELGSLFMVYDYTTVAENNDNSLNVYPNPANDKLFIDGVEGETVRVYDNMGRLVVEELYKGHLDVSGFAQGIYAVSVGNNVVKFVKK